jgi:Acetyltransferase (GNAT) domain
VRGRPRTRILTQSTLTQTLGPWVAPSGAKPARALSREHELLADLEAQLPPAHAFSQQFSPAMLNALPFYWAGYRIEVRYTYRLDGLRSPDQLWAGLRDNVRREIRKARRRVEVVDDLGVDRFYEVLSRTYARQRIPTPRSLAELERLDAACAPPPGGHEAVRTR